MDSKALLAQMLVVNETLCPKELAVARVPVVFKFKDARHHRLQVAPSEKNARRKTVRAGF
jgi:hypothetical protein